jgi:citrate synthase
MSDLKKETLTLIDNRVNKTIECDIYKSNLGSSVVDISSLNKELDLFTYDNGFGMSAGCTSKITYIDGAKGELLYRGYPIEFLAKNHNYLEVCYLILKGELPNDKQKKRFEKSFREHDFIHEHVASIIQQFPSNAHIMAVLSSCVSALSVFHYQYLDSHSKDKFSEIAKKIIAKLPTLVAFSYKNSVGLPVVYPDCEKSFAHNFLHMIRSSPVKEAKISPLEIQTLDTIFMLHADHEQSASTSTVRLVASTGAHPYAAITAGINALWGRAHGGANESVLSQLEMIGSVDRVDEYIKKAKDPNDEFRLMGFGHRVYKNFDPRANVLKKLRDKLQKELGVNSHLIEVSNKIEQIALSDEYFIKRNLYPNIDFYSGTLLTALNIPLGMFTPIFVIGRSVGWISHWFEQIDDGINKIVRPRQRYMGKTKR